MADERTAPPVTAQRSRNMAAIRGRDTGPERQVRRLLHRMGFRFRLHRRDLPGTPDIVMPRFRTVILVHGCFWHRHPGCRFSTTPRTRSEFWQEKFRRNVERDHRQRTEIEALGWSVIVVWECELRDPRSLEKRLGGQLRPMDPEGTGKP
ncbi:MAG: DNA mismatch endonuclease Vsr [Prochlorococcaceae cyanobacterium]